MYCLFEWRILGVYEIREKVDDADFTEYYSQQDKFNLEFLKTWGGTWQEYGAPNALPNWNSLVSYVQANNMATPANFDYVDSLLNWESMVDYFVLNSYIVSKDWLNWNTGWWRGLDPDGDKKDGGIFCGIWMLALVITPILQIFRMIRQMQIRVMWKICLTQEIKVIPQLCKS